MSCLVGFVGGGYVRGFCRTELKQDDTEEFRQRVQRADLLVREMKGEETCENDDDDTRTEEER